MSHIILEGPDGSGKSTLARKLVESKGLAYRHNGLYPKDSGQELMERYTRQLLCPVPSLMDRSYLSEHAYGMVMRQSDRLDTLGRHLLHLLCQALGVVQIVCLPPWDVVKANWTEKRKEKWDPVTGKGDYVDGVEKAYAIWRKYERLMFDMRLLPHNYTWTPGGMEELLFEGKLHRPRSLPAGCLGHVNGRFLVVGERTNTRKTKIDLPFFQLQGCSVYLHNCIREAQLPERDLVYTNALGLRGQKRNLRKIIAALPHFSHALALGAVAAEACHDQGIPYIRLPHPSLYRRFHYDNTQNYINLFREVTQDESAIRKLLRRVDRTSARGEMPGDERRAARAAYKRIAAHAAGRPRSSK